MNDVVWRIEYFECGFLIFTVDFEKREDAAKLFEEIYLGINGEQQIFLKAVRLK